MISNKTISYFEIAILIIGIFAFSWIISEIDKQEITQAKEKSYENNILIKLILEWNKRSKILPSVSAQSLTMQCCPKMKTGALCQDIVSSQCGDLCSESCLPTQCSETMSCVQGCCYDKSNGVCSNGAVQSSCEGESLTWTNDRLCNVESCRLGCCVLGQNTQFVNERKCEILSGFYNVDFNFKSSITTEIECLALANQQAIGACVIEDEERNCKLLSKAECLKLTGNSDNFYENYLCSNSELDTKCERQKTTNCVSSKDEVYWFDSCGNRENIYDSDKDKSWNNGKILAKEESCNLNSGNSASCGNCNYFKGSICALKDKSNVDFGNYICRNLDCKNAPSVVDAFGKVIETQNRRNGESWCVYDGKIGSGKDVAGSRHYKYYCIDGIVKAEPCGDLRTGICVQSDIDVANGKLSQAACRPNRAMECLSYNSKEENQDEAKLKDECEKNSDCEIRNFDFGKNYKFSLCSSKYPIGLDFSKEDLGEVNQKICNQANFECTKVSVKEITGWKCVSGCECDSKEFTKQMNEWCISLGDCGAKSNIAGVVTTGGYSVKKAPKLNSQDYRTYATPVSGQKANPGNISEELAAYYGWGASSAQGLDYVPQDSGMKLIGMTIGATGVWALIGTALIYGGGGMTLGASFIGAMSTPFGSALIGATIGTAVGYIAAKLFGLQGQAALIVTVAGALAGAGAFVGFLIAGKGAAACIGPHAIACLIIIIIVVLISVVLMKIFGIGEVKKKIVTFTCAAWEAPNGGDNCGKCMEGGELKPCTRYKCESLGQTCSFINEGTGNEICYDSNPDDINSPIITPWKELISEGYQYTEIRDNSFKVIGNNGECLTEFTPIIFGIKTNEPGQCKYDVIHTTNYEEMENLMEESSLYKYNHSISFNMPSLDSIINEQENSGEENIDINSFKTSTINKFGNITFYVRCKDASGNFNINEYFINTCVKAGPDLTAPSITKTSPSSTDYIAFNKTKIEATIWVNEPANCKYSISDKDYTEMESEFSCLTDIKDADIYGWKCSKEISDLKSGDNKFYIKCKDQPWLPDTNTSRNKMATSYILNIKKSQSDLTITSIQPNSTITVGTEPATATLTVKTSGGAESGKSSCSYSFTNEKMIQMKNTFSSESTQLWNQLLRGVYTVYVKCKDIAGNSAEGTTSFEVQIDLDSPRILRAYNSGGLKIITNENAECVYDTKSCEFIWQNATKMSGLSKEHTASWTDKTSYYIKCKDIYDNKPDTCSIIIKATK